jgi:hypothetical protein
VGGADNLTIDESLYVEEGSLSDTKQDLRDSGGHLRAPYRNLNLNESRNTLRSLSTNTDHYTQRTNDDHSRFLGSNFNLIKWHL